MKRKILRIISDLLGERSPVFLDRMAYGEYCVTRNDAYSAVGPGWRELIKTFYDKLPSDYVVFQVKEKFATLCIYCTGNEEMFSLIDVLEKLSQYICESCGKSGKLRIGGWDRTLCDDCAREMGYII